MRGWKTEAKMSFGTFKLRKVTYRVIQDVHSVLERWQYRLIWGKEVHMNTCLIPNGHRHGAASSSDTTTVWMVIKKEKLHTGNILTFISCLNNTFVTYKSQTCYSSQRMFENPTLCLSALCNSCFSSKLMFTFLYACSSIQNAAERFVSSIRLPL